MEKHDMEQEKKISYTIKDFLPLTVISIIVVVITIIKQAICGFEMSSAMYDFMGSYFIIFGTFKIINLKGFAEAYSTYDIIAKRFIFYAYMYPFLELLLGILYFFRIQLLAANYVTLFLMVISSIGVANELAQKKTIMCACLGVVFKIPMTYVTFAEDIIMALMALIMLLYGHF